MNEHIKAHEINNNNGKNAAGSQVHVCPFELCRKKFFRLSKYQDHLNTHTRIEPYECQHYHKKKHKKTRNITEIKNTIY